MALTDRFIRCAPTDYCNQSDTCARVQNVRPDGEYHFEAYDPDPNGGPCFHYVKMPKQPAKETDNG